MLTIDNVEEFDRTMANYLIAVGQEWSMITGPVPEDEDDRVDFALEFGEACAAKGWDSSPGHWAVWNIVDQLELELDTDAS